MDSIVNQWKTMVVWALLLALGAWAGWHYWRTASISDVQRGADRAALLGCFGCHGPGGTHGIPNPGCEAGRVPSWDGGTVMMFADNETELREWILDGAPAGRRKAGDWESSHAPWLVRMPAYRSRVSGRAFEELVAFVKAVSWLDKPKGDLADKGRDVAAGKGCFSCHGPEGRGCMPNPGSFKGYIPAWDGPEFSDVAANETEIREWILDGVCKRIANHPVGGFFVKRQRVPMPAFRGRLTDEELNATVAYIRWLREARL